MFPPRWPRGAGRPDPQMGDVGVGGGRRGEGSRRHRPLTRQTPAVPHQVVAAASAVPDDQHRGVRPQQLQVLHEDGGAGPRAGPRTHGMGPGRAGPHLGPRTPPGTEMEVSFGQAERADHCMPVTCDKQGSRTEQADDQVPPGRGVLRELPAAGGPDPEPSEDCPDGGVAPGGSEPLVTIMVQCAFTLALRAPRGVAPPTLRALLSQALPLQAQRGQLSYRDPGSGLWVPLPEEGVLQTAWWESASGPAGLRLQCRGAGGRPILYQVVAQHGYSAQGPEDLDLQPGDIVDVLCEVDQAWLEGHCDGCFGIFPKCFVVPACPRTQRGQP
ncbi:NADPH oxidase activator 1 [Pteropus vampyrus]|uniref:NADPH oxidase activator 1 n=1 Tax=Pteropus vampyrus TaxID=132908 RepID=A0A6P6CZA6_PTEVA|nr:NADPH oxidase activator 1 [Pteropus vampyrus]